MKRIAHLWIATYAACLSLLAGQAEAAIVTWSLGGGVAYVDPGHAAQLGSLGVDTHSAFTALITLDTSIVASDLVSPPVNYCCGHYENPILAISFQAGAYSSALAAGSPSEIFAPYNYAYFTVDAPKPAGPLTLSSPRFFLEVQGTLALNGTHLPTAPPLAPGIGGVLHIYDDAGEALYANVNYWSYSVPEPDGEILLSALCVLLTLKAGRPPRA